MLNLSRTTILASLAALSTAALLPLLASPARAQIYCQCTQYVANRFGLPNNFPNAGDWNDGYLQRNGFTQVNAQPGAIVVMERSFPGSDATYGHVGIVESITSDGRLTVRGANQSVGSGYVTESGCNNVRLTAFGRSINGRSDISFWKRGNTGGNTGGDTSFYAVNFSATAAPTGVNIRSAPSTTASIVGRISPNQRINFDGWKFGETVPDFWTNAPDARWYRIAGTNNWVASAVVSGNAPGSRPMP